MFLIVFLTYVAWMHDVFDMCAVAFCLVITSIGFYIATKGFGAYDNQAWCNTATARINEMADDVNRINARLISILDEKMKT